VAEGAEPLKPQNAIPSAVILITKTVVAGFRGEKNEGENGILRRMQIHNIL